MKWLKREKEREIKRERNKECKVERLRELQREVDSMERQMKEYDEEERERNGESGRKGLRKWHETYIDRGRNVQGELDERIGMRERERERQRERETTIRDSQY